MIEIINNCLAAFFCALVIYSFFSKRPWIDLAIIPLNILSLAYFVGYNFGVGKIIIGIVCFIALLAFTGTIIWRIKKALAEEEKEERTYSREELIIAKKIYDKNYMEDPEGFAETKGTYDDAQVSVDYLLGIINANAKPFKKEWYEYKIKRS